MAAINKIGEMIEQDTKWIRFEAGDKKVLRFNQDKEPKRVESEFQGNPTLRYEFEVHDVNAGVDKSWTVSKTVAGMLRDYFAEGCYTLKIERKGTGINTRYTILSAEGIKNE